MLTNQRGGVPIPATLSDEVKIQALDRLISNSHPPQMKARFWEVFGGWMCSEYASCLSDDERVAMWEFFRDLVTFFEELEGTSHCQTRKEVLQ